MLKRKATIIACTLATTLTCLFSSCGQKAEAPSVCGYNARILSVDSAAGTCTLASEDSTKLTAEVFTADCSDAVLTELSKPEEPDPSQPDDVQVEEIPLSDFAPGDKVVLTFPIPEEGKDEWVDVTQMQKTYLAEE